MPAARKILVWECVCQHSDCGHVWIAREKPGKCAKCKRRTWETGETVYGRPPVIRQRGKVEIAGAKSK